MRPDLPIPARTTLATDWADLLGQHFVALDVEDLVTDRPFTGVVRSSTLAYLQVSSVQSTEQRIARTKALINSDCSDYLQIGLLRRGNAVVSQDGRQCTLTSGDYVLYDTARPFDWQFQGGPGDASWGLEVFTWPKAQLALSDSEISNMTAVTLDGRAGMSGLLGRFLHDLASMGSGASQSAGTGEQIVEEISGLVTSVLNATVRPSRSRNSPLYDQAVSVIDERIGDQWLGPTDIASSVGVSIRQLHRVFAEHHSTISRTIRSRRLAQCRRDMLAHGSVGRSLSQISSRWGFADLSSFSRAFKDEFGVSPRTYRAQTLLP